MSYNSNSVKKIQLKCDNCLNIFERKLLVIEKYQLKSNGKNLCKSCYCNYSRKIRLNQFKNDPNIKKTDKLSKNGKTIYSITCKFCQNEFEVTPQFRHKIFCSKSCQVKGSNRISIKVKSLCKICGNEFEHYGERHVCGELCLSKYMSQMRLGENNPAFKENKHKQVKCKYCNKDFFYDRVGLHKDQEKFFCNSNCHKNFQKEFGQKIRFNDEDYTSYDKEKYIKFTKKLKNNILKRDNNTCCLCGETWKTKDKKFPIHHIDYDTNNQEESNLITLCMTCHNWTNKNQTFWQNVFASLRSGSKIVNKGWGLESHITNGPNFCLKYLIFFENHKISFHVHGEKTELFHCLQGKLACRLQKNGIEEKLLIKAGDKIMIEPGTIHQLEAIKNSIIIEVSTTDFPEDSYRISPGDSQKV